MEKMQGIGDLFKVTPYDGCGKCLVAVVRLSRVTDATSSPQRQAKQINAETKAVGGHIIGVADDMEVSGAVNPLDRPKFGPWLRDEMGPYAGIVAASVDRIGRNLVDVLTTGYMMRDTGKLLVTYRHGVWDLHDATEENQFTMEAWSAQMELRSIQRRNRDETERARSSFEKRNRLTYGYRAVRLTPMGKVDHIELDPRSAKIRREIGARILADKDDQVTPHTEAQRLNRAGEISPRDYERMGGALRARPRRAPLGRPARAQQPETHAHERQRTPPTPPGNPARSSTATRAATPPRERTRCASQKTEHRSGSILRNRLGHRAVSPRNTMAHHSMVNYLMSSGGLTSGR
ncbi:MAG: recombinase family protein [Sciscionella sp.]